MSNRAEEEPEPYPPRLRGSAAARNRTSRCVPALQDRRLGRQEGREEVPPGQGKAITAVFRAWAITPRSKGPDAEAIPRLEGSASKLRSAALHPTSGLPRGGNGTGVSVPIEGPCYGLAG